MSTTIIGRRWYVLLLPVFLAACSNIKPYQSDLEKNFRVEPKVSSGSFSRDVSADLDIFEVNAKCELNYVGSVHFDNKPTAIGLPVNRPVYLEFSFSRPAGFFNSASSTTVPVYLQSRPGQHFVAEISYLDDFYKVQLREGGRIIEKRSLAACKKSNDS